MSGTLFACEVTIAIKNYKYTPVSKALSEVFRFYRVFLLPQFTALIHGGVYPQ